jgi:hypothetical protein
MFSYEGNWPDRESPVREIWVKRESHADGCEKTVGNGNDDMNDIASSNG